MPDEEARFNVDLLAQLIILISVLSSVINHEFVVDFLVDVA